MLPGFPNDGPAGWTLSTAVELCRKVEAVCPEFGFHVALTGGTLYKDGVRKDCDLLFYRIRQYIGDDTMAMFKELKKIGLKRVRGFGWCHKATYNGLNVDCFFPDADGGDHNSNENP